MSENCIKNKPYNGCRGIQTVRMMVASLLQYDIYLAAQFPVTLGEFLQIVLIRHRGVRVASYRNDWNVRLCKRLEMVERVVPKIIGFLGGKSPFGYKCVKKFSPFLSRPAVDIANRRIEVDAAYLVGIAGSSVDSEQTAAAESFHNHLLRKVVVLAHISIESVSHILRARTAIQVGNVVIYNVIPQC